MPEKQIKKEQTSLQVIVVILSCFLVQELTGNCKKFWKENKVQQQHPGDKSSLIALVSKEEDVSSSWRFVVVFTKNHHRHISSTQKNAHNARRQTAKKSLLFENLWPSADAAAAIARKAKLNHTDYSDLKTTPHLAPSHCFALFRYKKKEPSWGLYFCRWLYQYDSVHFCLSGIKSLTSVCELCRVTAQRRRRLRYLS